MKRCVDSYGASRLELEYSFKIYRYWKFQRHRNAVAIGNLKSEWVFSGVGVFILVVFDTNRMK